MSSFPAIIAASVDRALRNHRRRLHGGDGGDRRYGQKVVGTMPQVAHTGILLCHFFEN